MERVLRGVEADLEEHTVVSPTSLHDLSAPNLSSGLKINARGHCHSRSLTCW